MQFFLHSFDDYAMLASADKGTHARRTLRPAFRCVIVLDRRQPACVLCLAKNVPERPAGLRVFPEHGRQLARQTRQAGCRPPTRITKPAVAQARENHVGPCQLTLTSENHKRIPARSVEHGDKRTNRAVCFACSFSFFQKSDIG